MSIARAAAGEPGPGGVHDYGYATATVVILPRTATGSAAATAATAGALDGVWRYEQEPHKLVADLLAFLAAHGGEAPGEDADDGPDTFLLPLCKCAVVSVEVCSHMQIRPHTPQAPHPKLSILHPSPCLLPRCKGAVVSSEVLSGAGPPTAPA